MNADKVRDRILVFDFMVRMGRYPNASDLAIKFSISERQAHRDIEHLKKHYQVPLAYDRQRHGYYYTEKIAPIRISSVHLTESEILSLILARQVARELRLPLEDTAFEKSLKEMQQRLKSIIAEDVDPDSILWVRSNRRLPLDKNVFLPLLKGCLKRQRVLILHAPQDGRKAEERKVEPLHFFYYKDSWHLFGFCMLRNDYRDFNISRIKNSEVLDETFPIREDYKGAEYFEHYGVFQKGCTTYVKLRFTQRVAPFVREEIWHVDQEQICNDDGSLDLIVPVASYEEIEMEILRYGPDVEVLEPDDLRRLIYDKVRATYLIYNKEIEDSFHKSTKHP